MKSLKSVLLVGLIVAAAFGLYQWWAYQEAFPSTDDATLQADILTIAPQVAGKVDSVAVVENGYVKAGDVLFTLDAGTLQAAVSSARATGPCHPVHRRPDKRGHGGRGECDLGHSRPDPSRG